MKLKAGVLCSGDGLELAALIEAVESDRLPVDIRVVVTDRDSPALTLARYAGLQAVFLPRTAFHANRDGYERRLVQILTEAGADAVIMAGYDRELGTILAQAFHGRVIGRDLGPEEVVAGLEKAIRSLNISLVAQPAAGGE